MEKCQRAPGSLTVSLTLPLACNICLGKVKEPVVCSNHHVFCTVCLDEWLKMNGQCPSCRTPIANRTKLLGGGEDLKEIVQDRSVRDDLRRTRLELICKEYENDYSTLQCEVDELRSSNALLQEEMKKSREVGDHSYALPSSLDIDKLTFVASQLKEMTELYEKMKARMEKLKEENEKLSNENYLLRGEVAHMKRTDKASPSKVGLFAVAGLETRIQKHERQETQLQKALQRSDQYIEKLEAEVKSLKESSAVAATEAAAPLQVDPNFATSLIRKGKSSTHTVDISTHFPIRRKSFRLGAVGSLSLKRGSSGDSIEGSDGRCSVHVDGTQKKLKWTL